MSEIKLVHYRNGVYQGELKANKREGKGILITDEGQIVVGTWKNDKLSGNVLMFLNQS